MKNIFFVTFYVMCLIQPGCSHNDKDKILQAKQVDSIYNIMTEGDIVFRSGTDIESSVIKDFSNIDKLFSHCGIILRRANKLEVTHILGGTTF
jgi:hypothetical protein